MTVADATAAPPVVVLTGASSGIGRETARMLAARGSRLVLAGRDAETLEQAASECRSLGGQAVAVCVDVTDEGAAELLASRALGDFGRIDVWVNDAAVMAYGRFDDIPPDVYRKVVETDLLAPIQCSRVAMKAFRRQGAGILVNVGSLYGRMTSPYVGPYVTAKFGLHGFTEVLRQELSDSPDIHVCLVLPGSVDTPIFRHTANYLGRAARPVPPVTDVAQVAGAIVDLTERPRPQVIVGRSQQVMSWGRRLFPRLYDRLAAPVMDDAGLTSETVAASPGNVFEPMPEWNRRTGGWGGRGDLLALGRGARAVVTTLARRALAIPGRLFGR